MISHQNKVTTRTFWYKRLHFVNDNRTLHTIHHTPVFQIRVSYWVKTPRKLAPWAITPNCWVRKSVYWPLKNLRAVILTLYSYSVSRTLTHLRSLCRNCTVFHDITTMKETVLDQWNLFCSRVNSQTNCYSFCVDLSTIIALTITLLNIY